MSNHSPQPRRHPDRESSEPLIESSLTSPITIAATLSPGHDAISHRAYELYQQRGGGEGQAWDDWLRAERELREEADANCAKV